jgi:arsenate reductase
VSEPKNVLFLCTRNSARGILAESLLNHWGQGRFKGYSAGYIPKGEIHPYSIELLNQFGMPTEGLRSKSWDEFAQPSAPAMDFVFTVCDQAAGETLPVWPVQPVTAHWGVADPTAVEGNKAMQALAFRQAFATLERRIRLFLDVRQELDRRAIEKRVREIGRTGNNVKI